MFTFGVVHAATAYVLDPSETMISTFPPSINIAPVVNITLSTTTLLLSPGTSANITAQFVFQLQDVDPVLLPIYSGYITVQSNASGDLGGLQIPFLGAAFNMTTLPIYDRVDGFPSFTGTSHNGTFFTADGTVFTMTNNDFPQIDFRLIFGTRVLQLDALPGTNTTTSGTQPFAGLNTLGYISRTHRKANRIEASQEPRLSESGEIQIHHLRRTRIRYFGMGRSIPERWRLMDNIGLRLGR